MPVIRRKPFGKFSPPFYLLAAAGLLVLCGEQRSLAVNHPAPHQPARTPASRPLPASDGKDGPSPGPAFENSHIPTDEWFVMSIVGRPVGFTHDSYAAAVWRGRRAWRFEEDFHLVVGKDAFFNTKTVNFTRPDGSYLETNVIRDDPSGHETTHILYNGSVIDAKATRITQSGGTPAINVRPIEITLPKGVSLAPQTPYQLPPADVRTGRVIHQWSLDNDKLKLQHQLATVGAPEMLDMPGRGITKVWKVRVHTEGDPDDYYIWVDSNGDGIKVSLPLQGVQLVGILTPYNPNRPHDTAKEAVWKLRPEGTLAAAPRISSPRDANALDLSLTGAPAGLHLPSDGPQRVLADGSGSLHVSVAMPGLPETDPTAIFSGASTPGPSKEGDEVLVIGPSTQGEMPLPEDTRQSFLRSTRLITADAPEIVSLARNLTRSAPTPVQKCMILRDWVSSHVQEDGRQPIDRTAVTVLHNPRGACRDYATLYAALARAVGIPTRICAGVVYDSGVFWGHCWNESWTGSWTPVDASMEGHFVDATHVKFAQGDAADAIQGAASILLSLANAHTQMHIDWVQPASAR